MIKAEGVSRPVLEKIGVSADPLREKLEQALDAQPSVHGGGVGQVYLGDELNVVLKEADKKRTELKDDYFECGALFTGTVSEQYRCGFNLERCWSDRKEFVGSGRFGARATARD